MVVIKLTKAPLSIFETRFSRIEKGESICTNVITLVVTVDAMGPSGSTGPTGATGDWYHRCYW